MIINISVNKDKFLPCYQHLFDKEFFDIDFMYGGRDSGKSRDIAMRLLLECLSADYFRCVLIRKVKDTLKDSQWQMIKDVAQEWKIDHLFSFNTSPLEIRCKNGNKFICRGCDEPQKLKSIANPSHCWIEEGNELSNTDFTIILSTLRYNEGNVKVWFSFNPECEGTYTEFWLYQEWFEHSTELSWKWIKQVEVDDTIVEYKARATHSTYRNNPYCKPQRKALYESYKNSKNNSYWYQTYTLGLWGYRRAGGEFLKCFDESVHTKDMDPIDNTFHLVVDNNVSPYVSIQVWQVDQGRRELLQVDELPCRHPSNTASKAALEAAKWLSSRDYNDTVFVYGDPSANAKSTNDDDGRSFFDKFISTLQQSGFSVHNRVKKSAPRVAASGDFINEIYESNYMGWKILVSTKCRVSIEDYVMTKEASDGTVLKKRETDKDTKQTFERYGHFVDCQRYFVTTVLEYEFQQYGRKKSKIYGYSV